MAGHPRRAREAWYALLLTLSLFGLRAMPSSEPSKRSAIVLMCTISDVLAKQATSDQVQGIQGSCATLDLFRVRLE